jgi:class 3 adenylate cyclase
MVRQVATAIEPLINRHATVLKRLGDGVMAVFNDARKQQSRPQSRPVTLSMTSSSRGIS